MSDRESHWQGVYTTKAEDNVSWFEESPDLSLALLAEAGLVSQHAVVDVGGGASRLVDALVAVGQQWVSVLDLSQAALNTARSRLLPDASADWIVADVTAWQPERHYDYWHDRAAFHFGGVAIIGTFAPDGPEKCSGLAVARHDSESLSNVMGDDFALIAQRRHDHTTPWGSVQKFQFCTFRQRIG
jgi:hypothetical protein